MPWCPICKAEYQEGFTQCKDCKVPLVDKLEDIEAEEPYVTFFQAEEEKIAKKLASFFEYSDLPSKTHYDEETESYIIEIPASYEEDARKLYEAFYVVEAERAAKEAFEKKKSTETASDESDEDTPASPDAEDAENMNNKDSDDETSDEIYQEEADEPETDFIDDGPSDDIASFERSKGNESVYVMKSDQYKDLAGTVYIFLIFGVAGFIFVLLNVANILNVFNGWLPNTVMGALFLLFIYIAISTNKKAKKIRSEIDAENILTRDINNWLKENITKDFLASIHNENISEEANYINNIDVIKEMLLKEFGPQNLAYLDHLIDEFYTNSIDNEDQEAE